MSDMRAKYAILGLTITIAMTGVLYALPTDVSVGTTTAFPLMVGHFDVTITDSDGNVKYYAQTDNVVTDEGLDCALSNMFDTDDLCTSTTAFIHIALGNTAYNDVTTTTEAIFTGDEVARETAAPVGTDGDGGAFADNTTDDTVTMSETFTVIANDANPNNGFEEDETAAATAIFDTATITSGNMLAVADLPQAISGLNIGDTIAITWTITAT